MAELWNDFLEHWDDSYWWADHQLLMALLIGIVGLLFHGLHLALDRKWGIDNG